MRAVVGDEEIVPVATSHPGLTPVFVFILKKSGVDVAVPATVVVEKARIPPSNRCVTCAFPAPSEKERCGV